MGHGETSTRNLDCKLTKKEKGNMALEVVDLLEKIDDNEKEKKASVDGYKARAKILTDEIKHKRTCLKSGLEEREVECREEWDWAAGTKTLIRLDNNESVWTKDLTPEERQEVLNFNSEPVDAEYVDDEEETSDYDDSDEFEEEPGTALVPAAHGFPAQRLADEAL